MAGQKSYFLDIPLEIRELIFDIVLHPTEPVIITAAPDRVYEYNLSTETNSTTWPADFESWEITHHPHSAQLLRVCSQIHREALPFLYSLRSFNLTARESLKLLLHNIKPRCFALIRSIKIEWEALQTFAWDLSKDDFCAAVAGLRCIQLATYRIRHMRDISVKWRNVRSYERMMLQAALDITQKHAFLKIVAEEPYRRRSSSVVAVPPPNSSTGCKVRWRFITAEEELREGEVIADIQRDLEIINNTLDEADYTGLSLPAIDSL